MKKEIIITWILLIFLTVISAIISKFYFNGDYLVEIIMLLAVLKFIGVALNFMELKKAHIFWRIFLIAFLIIFFGSILFL